MDMHHTRRHTAGDGRQDDMQPILSRATPRAPAGGMLAGRHERWRPKRHDGTPMYLSMLPPLRLIGSDITVKYLLITATSAFGLKP